MTAQRVASLSELADESATRVDVAGTPVCLARSQGQVFAVNDICSHADVSLAEGDVEVGQRHPPVTGEGVTGGEAEESAAGNGHPAGPEPDPPPDRGDQEVFEEEPQPA